MKAFPEPPSSLLALSLGFSPRWLTLVSWFNLCLTPLDLFFPSLLPLSLLGVGIFGLTGVDQLLCFMIVSELSSFARLFRKVCTKPVQGFLGALSNELHPTSQFPPNAATLYPRAAAKLGKLVPVFLSLVTAMGQMQLLRRQIANELNFSAKLDSGILSSGLEAINLALTNDVRAHYADPDKKPYPGNPTLPDISDYLETAGQQIITPNTSSLSPASFVSHASTAVPNTSHFPSQIPPSGRSFPASAIPNSR
jgi:hypothetical protein